MSGQWALLPTSSYAVILPSIVIRSRKKWKLSLPVTISLSLVCYLCAVYSSLEIDFEFLEEYWANVSGTARDFVSFCLTLDPAKRPTAEDALKHKWLSDDLPHFVQNGEGMPADLLPHIKKQFDAKKTWKKAVFSITAVKRMTSASAKTEHLSLAAQALAPHLESYKEESEKVRFGVLLLLRLEWDARLSFLLGTVHEVGRVKTDVLDIFSIGNHRRGQRRVALRRRWRGFSDFAQIQAERQRPCRARPGRDVGQVVYRPDNQNLKRILEHVPANHVRLRALGT